MPDPEGRYSSYKRRRQAYDRNEETTPSRLSTALLIGFIVGLLCIALNVALTFLNAPIIANEGKEVTGNTYALIGLGCLSFFIQLLASFIAGFIVGKTTVQRQFGLYAGALTTFIAYLASFVVRYVIPNYPGNQATTTPASGGIVAGGIVTIIVFLIIWSLIGGLIGLWGARISTRNHPAYVGAPRD